MTRTRHSILKWRQRRLLHDIQPFPPEKYKDIDLDRLTAYAVKYLTDRGIECTFENLVVVLFKFFPEKFSLVGYPEYPDSARVHNSIDLHCRPKYKDFAVGSKRRGWKLTDKGLSAAEEAAMILESSKPQKLQLKGKAVTPGLKQRTKAVYFVKEIQNSEVFERYTAGNKDEISKYDVCDLLHGTLDTPPSILQKNLDRLIDYTDIMIKTEPSELHRQIKEFLLYIKTRWRALIYAEH